MLQCTSASRGCRNIAAILPRKSTTHGQFRRRQSVRKDRSHGRQASHWSVYAQLRVVVRCMRFLVARASARVWYPPFLYILTGQWRHHRGRVTSRGRISRSWTARWTRGRGRALSQVERWSCGGFSCRTTTAVYII